MGSAWRGGEASRRGRLLGKPPRCKSSRLATRAVPADTFSWMRFYLNTAPDEFRSFVLMKEISPYNLLFMPCGLDRGQPTMTIRYPDRVVDTPNAELSWMYSEAQPTNVQVDHFTCHRDGRIHLKRRPGDGETLYSDIVRCDQPITAQTPRFFDAYVLGDRAAAYGSMSAQPKRPRIAFGVRLDEVVFIRARFSGVEYDLEREAEEETEYLRDVPDVRRVHTVAWKTIKAVMTFQKVAPPSAVFENRPKGTVVSAIFNIEDSRSVIRTMVFA